MESLKSLSIKYDVDTLELGYIPHYENLFANIRNDVTKVLEIGVETGRSHRMWLEYFPNATIYGFDIFEFWKRNNAECHKNFTNGFLKEIPKSNSSSD